MRALVVYESMFGNTRSLAEAVGRGLVDADIEVAVREVGATASAIDPQVRLLVVGAPTHAFGMSRPGTRASAAERVAGEVVSRDGGAREWLARLDGADGRLAAAFDTRVDKPLVPGSAARGIAKRLTAAGLGLAVDPETFFVEDMEGPVVDGELDRAVRWGARVGAAAREAAAIAP